MQLQFDKRVQILLEIEKPYGTMDTLALSNNLKELGISWDEAKEIVWDAIYDGAVDYQYGGSKPNRTGVPSIEVVHNVLIKYPDWVEYFINAQLMKRNEKVRYNDANSVLRHYFNYFRHDIKPEDVLTYHEFKAKGLSHTDAELGFDILDI